MATAAAADAAPSHSIRSETTPPWRWRAVGIALAVVALVGGVVLRVATPSPLWLDEALSVNIAQLGFADMVDALRRDGHPALYYLLLGWWIDLFGDSDLAVRSLSAVFSLLTVPALWAVARRHGPAVSSTTVLVALTSPFLLRHGSEARMYALLTLLVALGWWAVQAAMDRPDALRLVAVALATAALIHTHYWAFWVIGAALIVLAWTWWRGASELRSVRLRVMGAIGAGSATFVVWLGVFFDQLGSTGTPWAARARPAEIAIETLQAIGGSARVEGQFLGVILLVLALVGALATSAGVDHIVLRVGGGRLDGAGAMTLLTLTIGAIMAIATAGAFEARYAAAVVAFVLVLVARGIVMLPSRLQAAAIVGVVVYGLAVGLDEARRDRTQGGEVAAAIDAEWAPGDVVAFCPDQIGPATLRELTSPAASFAYPRGDGRFVDWKDYAEVIDALPAATFVDEVVTAAAGNDIWLVGAPGYRSLDGRCGEIIAILDQTHLIHPRLVPAPVFEKMLLTRYESRP